MSRRPAAPGEKLNLAFAFVQSIRLECQVRLFIQWVHPMSGPRETEDWEGSR
jgi:hypothetical protein